MESKTSTIVRRRDQALARAARAALFESLESRTLLAGDPAVSTFAIYGTDGPDNITVHVSNHSEGKYVYWRINGGAHHSEISHFFKTIHVHGNGGDDTVNGMDGADTINGNDGNDTLNGGNGTDTVSGGNGTDIVNGGNGIDTLNGCDGEDVLSG